MSLIAVEQFFNSKKVGLFSLKSSLGRVGVGVRVIGSGSKVVFGILLFFCSLLIILEAHVGQTNFPHFHTLS